MPSPFSIRFNKLRVKGHWPLSCNLSSPKETDQVMKSRYDRPDIGESPDYCAGLEVAEYDGPVCIYCNGPIADLDDYEPYCSQQCALWAELDSLEDN